VAQNQQLSVFGQITAEQHDQQAETERTIT
jgi:hypothetical protein